MIQCDYRQPGKGMSIARGNGTMSDDDVEPYKFTLPEVDPATDKGSKLIAALRGELYHSFGFAFPKCKGLEHPEENPFIKIDVEAQEVRNSSVIDAVEHLETLLVGYEPPLLPTPEEREQYRQARIARQEHQAARRSQLRRGRNRPKTPER